MVQARNTQMDKRQTETWVRRRTEPSRRFRTVRPSKESGRVFLSIPWCCVRLVFSCLSCYIIGWVSHKEKICFPQIRVLAWSLLSSLGCSPREPPASLCLHLSSTGITSTQDQAQHFAVGSGNQSNGLLLPQQVLYQLSYTPSP